MTNEVVSGVARPHSYDFIGNEQPANCLNQYLGLGYSANGELTSDGEYAYAYDALSRLTAVCRDGALVVSNRYDHLGRRVVKVAADGTHTFFYDGWRPVRETVAKTDGTTNRIEYVWGKDISGTLDGAAGIGGLLYVKIDGAVYVPFYDAYGNVMECRDADGAVVAAYVYDAFGKTVSQSGLMAEAFCLRYSTKCYEVETGLYYYGKRFYSPEWRRWMTRDPIEELGGVNLYGFCRNDPIANYDTDGRAYFAIRRLVGSRAQNAIGAVLRFPFISNIADAGNFEMVHEHLFYEDGSGNVGWGMDGAMTGDGDFMRSESTNGYMKRDNGYNDCIMRIAEGLVGRPDHYQAWFGIRSKCNCQDYCAKLRDKYNEIKERTDVRCKCKLPLIVR